MTARADTFLDVPTTLHAGLSGAAGSCGGAGGGAGISQSEDAVQTAASSHQGAKPEPGGAGGDCGGGDAGGAPFSRAGMSATASAIASAAPGSMHAPNTVHSKLRGNTVGKELTVAQR